MSWYSKGIKEEPKLDYSKPIFAGNSLILMPHRKKGSYEVIGYDWFRLDDGQFNSCVNWGTPQEAVKAYGRSYTISNGELEVKV